MAPRRLSTFFTMVTSENTNQTRHTQSRCRCLEAPRTISLSVTSTDRTDSAASGTTTSEGGSTAQNSNSLTPLWAQQWELELEFDLTEEKKNWLKKVFPLYPPLTILEQNEEWIRTHYLNVVQQLRDGTYPALLCISRSELLQNGIIEDTPEQRANYAARGINWVTPPMASEEHASASASAEAPAAEPRCRAHVDHRRRSYRTHRTHRSHRTHRTHRTHIELDCRSHIFACAARRTRAIHDV